MLPRRVVNPTSLTEPQSEIVPGSAHPGTSRVLGLQRTVFASNTALYSKVTGFEPRKKSWVFRTTSPLIKRYHSHPGCKPLVKKCHWRTERVRNDDLRSHDFPRHSTIFLYFWEILPDYAPLFLTLPSLTAAKLKTVSGMVQFWQFLWNFEIKSFHSSKKFEGDQTSGIPSSFPYAKSHLQVAPPNDQLQN